MTALNSTNASIRVTPEQLIALSGDAQGRISEMERLLETIKRKVDGTKNYWIGDAGNTCRRQYEKQQDEVSEIVKRLKAQPKTLLTIANVYVETERQTVGISAPLPGDVID